VATITPPMMLGMALLTLAVDSPAAVPITFGLIGTFLGVIVLFDFPIAVDLAEDYLVRVCFLRHQRIPWDDVGAIIKPRRRGLVLVTTRRKRHVLVDRILEPEERRALIQKGEDHGFQVEL
jgi:hypothetical protein